MPNSNLFKIFQLLNEIIDHDVKLQYDEIIETDLLNLVKKISCEKKNTESIISRLKENEEINEIIERQEKNQLHSILKALNYYRDKTIELKKLNDSLEKSNSEAIERENRLDEAQKIAKIGSWEIRVDTNETIWSKELYSIFEIEPSNVINLVNEFKNKIHPEDLTFFESMLSFDPKETNHSKEFRIICNTGIKIILATIYSSFEKGKNRYTLATFQDITAQKNAQQKLIEFEQIETIHKKKIIEAILFTKEKEQKRIAEELHDDIGSSLIVVKFTVHKLSIPQEDKRDLYDSISNVVEKVRTISNELSPNILNEFGLVNALTHLFISIQRSTFIQIHFQTEKEELDFLTKEEEISLYRIVQEIINNILKYAEAKIIHINLSFTKSIFMLSIEDDGIGFIPNKNDPSKTTLGLLNIESRIDYINASINYKINKHKGTIVKIEKKIV